MIRAAVSSAAGRSTSGSTEMSGISPPSRCARDREAIGRDLTWEELPEEDAVQALAAAWDDANAAAFG